MADTSVIALVHELLATRLQRLGLTPADLRDDLDLVRSGVVDSLGFVDLIASLEDRTGKRVELESALEKKEATTVGGIVRLFA